MDDDLGEAVLIFHEQSDGRKVSRLPGGKVVLVDLDNLDRVKNGERWRVTLWHRETFAIAHPVEKLPLMAPAPAPAPAKPAPASKASSAAVAAPPKPAPVASAKQERNAPFTLQGMLVEPENVVRNGERVAVFVDGANMDGACRSAGYFVDYRKALEYFLASGNLYAAFYYVADFTASDPLQQRFLDFLSHAGYIVRRKPVKLITDEETGERVFKGNLDTEIVLDMVNTAALYDVAFLMSGDSDFERAVDLLRSRGKRIYVISSRSSMSRELAYVADKPIFFIEDFKFILERDPKE
ncbi:MAG TPA: NYN domain-containing protein [Candidatus Thermoplasmatota archaeon]|nr:NYN domain-containing protein [Candidatus Thermoplasmatota archaeon]